ncbi:fungal-specific transcription factor domain-containing protein [Neurospora tetraspora]|uniref:Fungal-specific transcription factor domain-containing protein n=1 Tax=Neurospora tetraspora TaxID=94610 RepID=A0AAE0J867_9PEZI|nr:fungal-specific transcription factor domain-containing protein [Neurospora tetraspora]
MASELTPPDQRHDYLHQHPQPPLPPSSSSSEQRHPVGVHSLQAVPEPSVMKLTRGHSCVLCQQRKVRCDKQKPCANCVKAGVECRVVPPQPPRRRKKKPHERDLIDRLKKYESLLSQHGVNFEPIAHDLKTSDSIDDVADLEQDLSGLKTSPSSAADHVSPSDQGYDKQKWFPYNKEFRAMDEELADSSDEDCEGPTLHHAYDTMFDNNDGFPFVVGGSPTSVTNSHPSSFQIFQLWQTYITNVNPLLKLSHTSSLQKQIISAGAKPANIPKPLEVLMFAIYFAAVTSMTAEEVQTEFGEDRTILLAKYHGATQQALVNAGFMRSNEIMTLQAFLLYLLCVRQYVDPRSMFCLMGIAVRIATRIGIHKDGQQFRLPPFEVEQRRRLWWQIVILDKRIAEITGSAITALSSCGGDCRFPLNINDSDLNLHGKDFPTQYPGPTEMLFTLTRIELTVAAEPNGLRAVVTTPGGTRVTQPRVHFSPSPASPDVVTHVANTNLPRDLESFCTYMENAYLKYCDPKVPLHFFTLLMTRQALCKLRVIDFLCREATQGIMDHNERDALFEQAVLMVEYDNMLQGNELLKGFKWYTMLNFPLPAYIFLVQDLRTRTTGAPCERAWTLMIENLERRGLTSNLRTPMHIALGGFFVKAWDAHEAAQNQLGRHLQTPKIVTLMRNTAAKFKRPNSPPQVGSGPVGVVGGGMSMSSDPRQSVPNSATPPGMMPVASMPPDMAGMTGPHGLPGVSMQTGMYTTPKQMQQTSQTDTSPQMGSANMMMNDSMMFGSPNGGFDTGMGQMFGAGPSAPTPAGSMDLDISQMDWNYLVQLSSFGGFNPNYSAQMQYPHQPGPGNQ